MKIQTLIVDDSKAMLGVMKETLKELGIVSADSARSGEEALNIILKDKHKYQLIFVDLNMPGIDGMELIHELSDIQFKGGIVIFSELDEKIVQLAKKVSKTHRIRLLGCMNKPVTKKKIEPFLQKLKSLHLSIDAGAKQLTVEQIKKSLTEKRIIPYYQPMVDNLNGNVACLEVLARINMPGVVDAITAANFIGVAEDAGLIQDVTLCMIEAAFKDYPRIQLEFGKECLLSINISPIDLHNSKLPELILDLLNKNKLDPSKIILEVTENIALDKPQQLETLNRFRIKGFNIALDDFGTGYTNLNQIKNLPINEIKIDRSMIHNLAKDRLSQVVVHSLLDIFDELCVKVVAEGVEQPMDLAYLNDLRIPILLQGYIVSRPKSIDDICRWRKSWYKTII